MYPADGALDQFVDLPCTWPTSCAFGGPDFATLYVTSARFTMTAEHIGAHPEEGALFALDVGVRGRRATFQITPGIVTGSGLLALGMRGSPRA